MTDQDNLEKLLTVDRWYFNPEAKQSIRRGHELACGRVKLFLYESLYRSLTKHDLYECFQLAKLLPKLTYLDPYVLFRYLMILIESNKIEFINKNVITYLEQLFSKLYMNKPEIFVELISYFIKHNRIEDAKELYSQRNKYMNYSYHQKLSTVEINLKCYEFIFNHIQWKKNFNKEPHLIKNLSLQGRLVNMIDCIKRVKTNHEYFLLCLVGMLMHYEYKRKAYLIATRFRENNPNNITGHLLLLHIINKYDLIKDNDSQSPERSPALDELNRIRAKHCDNVNNFATNIGEEEIYAGQYAFDQDKQSIMKELRRLDIGRIELLNNITSHESYVDILRDLMDGMESLDEMKNIRRWFELKDTLENIFNLEDEIVILDVRFLWHSRYKRYWKNINFLQLIEKIENPILDNNDKQLISETLAIIYTKLDRPIR